MKTIYLDCFSGISGNMLIGAFLDAGLPYDYLKNQLEKIISPDEYSLIMKPTNKKGITATYFNVTLNTPQLHIRTLSDIQTIFTNSGLSQDIQHTSMEIFHNLAKAEAKIHGTSIEEIHFHEIGAVDAIIDIAGIAICLEYFNVKNIFVSNIYTGKGFVDCAHGQMPIPAPATAELLKNFTIKNGLAEKELVTPTGAAVLKTLAQEKSSYDDFSYDKIAYGAGSWDLSQPNVLRLYLKEFDSNPAVEDLLLLETNVDDMNPQVFNYISERLFKAGVLDVWITPIIMKKNRPGQMFSVLTAQKNYTAASEIIFRESTTLGLRISKIKRAALNRKIKLVSTAYGQIHCKIAYYNGKISNISAEYEDCRALAKKKNVPIREVQHEALRIAYYLADNRK
ncbi:nickel pincer cofactor biosynthesis protein LarC [Pectinatus frisingensis]|uniref:nickel pincer cofactor biosynthesis protein LarC n=1 Tax=Pectinatus frisingensis TaxID=865 RepID=UPI0018C61BDF|nr:nickel pincer cofactor biosynthesis protein LarC [Pectinatus frisingensis]